MGCSRKLAKGWVHICILVQLAANAVARSVCLGSRFTAEDLTNLRFSAAHAAAQDERNPDVLAWPLHDMGEIAEHPTEKTCIAAAHIVQEVITKYGIFLRITHLRGFHRES